MSLYTELKAAGIPIGSHESDLYFKVTPESLSILERHPVKKGNATRFYSQIPEEKGQLWMDVPFSYDPFWERKLNR